MSKNIEVQKVKVKRIPGTNTLMKVECYVGIDYATMQKDSSVFMVVNKAYLWEQIKKGSFGFRVRKPNFNGKA